MTQFFPVFYAGNTTYYGASLDQEPLYGFCRINWVLGINRMTIKTISRRVRLTHVTLSTTIGCVGIAVLFAIFYFGEPYIKVTEIRSTSEPRTVTVRWYLSCEEDYYEDEHGIFYEPQVPIGGVPPGVGPVMSSETEFLLVGYPYKELRRNVFTGSVNEQRSVRFDVIEWRVVTPYTTLEGDEFIESNKPLKWQSDKTAPQFFTQPARNRTKGC